MLTKNKLMGLTAIAMLVFIAISSIVFYVFQPQAQVVASAVSSNSVVSVGAPQNQLETSANENIKLEPLSKSVNDVTIEITSAKIIKTGVEIGICYTAVDNGEWRPSPGHLFYGIYEVYPDEIEFTTEVMADRTRPGQRCALVRYRIGDLNTLTVPLHFSITSIYAPGRELYSPCQEFEQRLLSNSKANAYGLQAKCRESADALLSVTLIGHGTSITKEKAQQVLNEIATAEIIGPWEFIIEHLEPLPAQ